MDQVNLGSVIEQGITRVTRNRIGEKPPVFVTLSQRPHEIRGYRAI